MLTLEIKGGDFWDEAKERFVVIKGQTIQLEHSLISISKWESKWKKAFLSRSPRTEDEIIDYVRCMTVTPGVDPDLYNCLTVEHIKAVQEYIDDPMSALVFRGDEQTPKKQQRPQRSTPKSRTSEQLYAVMAVLGIPFECQKWHLNRLLNLIHECELMNSGSKMSRKDSARYMSQMNAARRAKHHSRG